MKKKDEIAAELKALNVELGGEVANDPVFHTPENYFRDFPGQMAAIIKVMNADTVLSIPVAKDGPFTVPQDYFDTLDQDMLARVKAMDTIVTGTALPWMDARETPYHVPENYFDTFGQALAQKLFHGEAPAQEEILELSPLLAGLQKEQPFAVPGGYFNSEVFVKQVKDQQEQPKVVEHPSVRSIKWARWAAAAAVTAIFALGGMHYLVPGGGASSSKVSFEQALANIPDNNIKEWLSNNMDEADVNNLGGSIANINISGSSVLDNLSEQQIRDYLDAEMW